MKLTSVYDERYSGGYREELSGYEIARWEALYHFTTRVLKLTNAVTALDYGGGSGLHVGLWEKIFPLSELHFCDISSVAMEKFKTKYPKYADRYFLLSKDEIAARENTFDVIVSVEVMEHVEDLHVYLTTIHRLLKPGGTFVWTTPCGNRFSIEHLYSAVAGEIDKTDEGYRRWKWEDPTHLRRLKSSEITRLLESIGFSEIEFRFRAHFFSFVCSRFPIKRLSHFQDRLMTLDYSLFRRFPNGASMIGAAKKKSGHG